MTPRPWSWLYHPFPWSGKPRGCWIFVVPRWAALFLYLNEFLLWLRRTLHLPVEVVILDIAYVKLQADWFQPDAESSLKKRTP